MPERARFFVRIRAIAAQVILLRYYQDAMTRRRAEGRAFTLLHKNLGEAWAKVRARASGFARFRRAAAQVILLRYYQGVARHKGVKTFVLGCAFAKADPRTKKNDASPDIRKGEKTKMRRYGSLRTSILTYILYNVCNFSKYYKVLTFSRADKSRHTPPFSRLRRRGHRRCWRGHACPPLPKRRLAAFRANRRRAAT